MKTFRYIHPGEVEPDEEASRPAWLATRIRSSLRSNGATAPLLRPGRNGGEAKRTPRRQQAYIKLSKAEVAGRAYRLWAAAGRPHGRDLEFWLQAQVELLTTVLQSIRRTRLVTQLFRSLSLDADRAGRRLAAAAPGAYCSCFPKGTSS